MISLKSLPKLIPKTTYSSTACLNKVYQKSCITTAATATEFTEYSRMDANLNNIASTFNLFSIGLGPSSSHITGPMNASKIFVNDLKHHNILDKVYTLRVDMFGSLALTGKAHGTPEAILMGIEGESPDIVEASTIKYRVQDIYSNHSIHLDGSHNIHFNPKRHLVYNYFDSLPQDLNAIRFCAFDSEANMIATNKYFIDGGFIVNEETQINHVENFQFRRFTSFSFRKRSIEKHRQQGVAVVSLPFRNAEDLILACRHKNLTIPQIIYENNLKKSPTYNDNNSLRLRKKISNTK